MNYLVDKEVNIVGVSREEFNLIIEGEIFVPIRNLANTLGPSQLKINSELEIGVVIITAEPEAVEQLRALGFTVHEDGVAYAS